MLEMDVIPTKDNVIAVSHENSLKRLCGVNQLITETDFKDLPVYLPTFFTHFLNESVSFEGKKYRIPALEQVFRELPDIYICIEIKEPTDFAIREVKRLIDKYDRQNITVKIT